MKLSNILQGTALVVASVIGGNAQTIKNVVLVHGAWADGSSWSKVIPLLEAQGLNVVAVQIPLTSLADDVAATERAIALLDAPVLLVGHSYGGLVITEAGNDPKVAGLVYVAAFALDKGETIGETSKTFPPTPAGAELRPDAAGFLKFTPAGIEKYFAQDLSPTEQKNLTATQGPTSASIFSATVANAAWKTKPTWFAVASNDRTISPDQERFEAKRMNAFTITVSASHVAMLAQPAKIAELIEDATTKAGKPTTTTK